MFEYSRKNTHKLLIFLIKKASWYQPFLENLNINMYCDWRRWKHPRAILLAVFMTLVRSWGLIALLNSSDQTTHYFLFSFFIQYLLKAPSEVSIFVANTGNCNGHMVWDPYYGYDNKNTKCGIDARCHGQWPSLENLTIIKLKISHSTLMCSNAECSVQAHQTPTNYKQIQKKTQCQLWKRLAGVFIPLSWSGLV